LEVPIRKIPKPYNSISYLHRYSPILS
jgi:hypothetical protein